MKNTLFIALFFIAFSFTASAQTVKFGSVSSDEIVALMPEVDSAKMAVERRTAELRKEFQVLDMDYQKKLDVFQKGFATLSTAMRQAKEKELTDIQANMKQYEEAAQLELQEINGIAMKPAIDKIRAAIEKVAKANGVTFVLDKSQPPFIYMNEASVIDLTQLIKTELKLK